MSCSDSPAAIAIEPAPGWIGCAVHGDHMTLVDYRISGAHPLSTSNIIPKRRPGPSSPAS